MPSAVLAGGEQFAMAVAFSGGGGALAALDAAVPGRGGMSAAPDAAVPGGGGALAVLDPAVPGGGGMLAAPDAAASGGGGMVAALGGAMPIKPRFIPTAVTASCSPVGGRWARPPQAQAVVDGSWASAAARRADGAIGRESKMLRQGIAALPAGTAVFGVLGERWRGLGPVVLAGSAGAVATWRLRVDRPMSLLACPAVTIIQRRPA